MPSEIGVSVRTAPTEKRVSHADTSLSVTRVNTDMPTDTGNLQKVGDARHEIRRTGEWVSKDQGHAKQNQKRLEAQQLPERWGDTLAGVVSLPVVSTNSGVYHGIALAAAHADLRAR